MNNPDPPPLGYLLIRNGKYAGRRAIIGQTPFAIGRDQRCHLRPPDPTLSPVHAIIYCRDGRFAIQDRHSEGGTYVNGKRIDKAALKSGDRIRVGALELELAPAEQAGRLPAHPTPSAARAGHALPDYPGQEAPSGGPATLGYEIVSSPRSAYDFDTPATPRPEGKPKRAGNAWIGRLYAIAVVVVGVLALILVGSEMMGDQELYINSPSAPANYNSSGATLLYFYAEW